MKWKSGSWIVSSAAFLFFTLGCPWYFKSFCADTVYSHSKSKHSLAGQRTFGDWLNSQSLLLTSAKALVFLSSAECVVDIQHVLFGGEKRKFQDRISKSQWIRCSKYWPERRHQTVKILGNRIRHTYTSRLMSRELWHLMNSHVIF